MTEYGGSMFFQSLRARVFLTSLHKKIARRMARDIDAETGSFEFVKIPKIIWIYWHQGWSQAPYLAQKCLQTWQEKNPSWEVRMLDAENYREYADLSFDGWDAGIAHKTDVLRLTLLKQHGGVWVDATSICQTPLDDWLPSAAYSGFFAFERPFRDRILANWFLAATPGDPIVTQWEKTALEFWGKPGARAYAYLIHHYMFEHLCRTDAAFSQLWKRVPKHSAQPAHIGQFFARGRVSRDIIESLVRSGGAPVHKLTRKIEQQPEEIDELLELLSPNHVIATT